MLPAACVTVTVQAWLILPMVAVTVVVPALTAFSVTLLLPVVLLISVDSPATVTMLVSPLAQCTLPAVVSAGVTVAVSVPVLAVPSARRMVSVLVSSVIPVRATVTVTVQSAVNPPSAVLAVTVVLPPFFAVTTPPALTVAMLVSALSQVTVWLAAVAGATVAVSVAVSPFSIVTSCGVVRKPVTAMGCAVTTQVAFCPLPSAAVAVMVAVPPVATAVTLPFSSTVATSSLSDAHSTVLLFAVAGATTATSVSLLSLGSDSVALFSVTPVASWMTSTVQPAVLPSAVAVTTVVPLFFAVTVIVPVFVSVSSSTV